MKVRVPKLAVRAVTAGCLAAASASAVLAAPQPAMAAHVVTGSATIAHVVMPAARAEVKAAAKVATEAQAGPPTTTEPPTTAGSPTTAGDGQKGIAVWTFPGVDEALAQSGASWYYDWTPGQLGIVTPRGTQFVPMIWGPAEVTAATLGQVEGEGRYLLTFNEPDNSAQSNMTVAQALSLWPQLMATGMQLSSPAVENGAATPNGWLDQFMQGAKARGYRVNFIALHWYGADFATGAAVAQLKSYLQATYARYHLPIWLTEFALIRFGATETFPAPQEQAAFLTAATRMLGQLSYVQRYAWFGLPATAEDGSAGLFGPGAVATVTGRAFQAAP